MGLNDNLKKFSADVVKSFGLEPDDGVIQVIHNACVQAMKDSLVSVTVVGNKQVNVKYTYEKTPTLTHKWTVESGSQKSMFRWVAAPFPYKY